MSIKLKLDQPAVYKIQFLGRLDEKWSDFFSGMTMSIQSAEGQPTCTTLYGEIPDQSALYGILIHIRNLGLPLLKVEYIPQSKSQME